jgi:hypothetical protein
VYHVRDCSEVAALFGGITGGLCSKAATDVQFHVRIATAGNGINVDNMSSEQVLKGESIVGTGVVLNICGTPMQRVGIHKLTYQVGNMSHGDSRDIVIQTAAPTVAEWPLLMVTCVYTDAITGVSRCVDVFGTINMSGVEDKRHSDYNLDLRAHLVRAQFISAVNTFLYSGSMDSVHLLHQDLQARDSEELSHPIFVDVQIQIKRLIMVPNRFLARQMTSEATTQNGYLHRGQGCVNPYMGVLTQLHSESCRTCSREEKREDVLLPCCLDPYTISDELDMCMDNTHELDSNDYPVFEDLPLFW